MSTTDRLLHRDPHFGIFMPSHESLHENALHAFARGLIQRRLPFKVYPLDDGYQPCDIAVTFGIGKAKTPRGRAVGVVLNEHEKRSGIGRYLVVERGFIHRERYFMVGWGGLNGRADFRNPNCSGDRFRKLGVNVAPWRSDGEHILLCGQIPWDAAVQHSNHSQWCRETALDITRLTSRPIIFRPHPLQIDAVDIQSLASLSTKPTLQEDLLNAWAVVTYNSNAGVEALLAGIPAFVSDVGAMGFTILNKDLRAIESPLLPDRRQWLFNLAYTQWNLDEISSGLAIMHLWEKQWAAHQRLWSAARNAAARLRSAVFRNSKGDMPERRAA